MSSKAICIRETLYSAIRSVSAVSWLLRNSQIMILLQMFGLPLCHAYFLPHLAVLISDFPLFHDNS